MNLTKEEIKAIEKAAREKYKIVDGGFLRDLKGASRLGYIEGATQERLKAKALIEALERIKTVSYSYAVINLCEIAINEYK